MIDRKLWKLQQISEKLWILASMLATEAAALGYFGRGFAVVAEETRTMAYKLSQILELALYEEEELDEENLCKIARELHFLSMNCEIEANRLDTKGKKAAVYADDLHTLSRRLGRLLNEKLDEEMRQRVRPWPKKALTSLNTMYCFLVFRIGDIPVVENLDNVRELIIEATEADGKIKLRNREELPAVNIARSFGKEKKASSYVILHTPWAAQNKTYAVAADEIEGIYANPIGTPVAPPAQMPLAEYVRECWENENGEPYYFMNWEGMV